MRTPIPEPLYFARMDNGSRVLLRDVQPVEIHDDGQFILHRGVGNKSGWTVTEVTTGLRVSSGATPDAAIDRARVLISSSTAEGESLVDWIERAVNRFTLVTAN